MTTQQTCTVVFAGRRDNYEVAKAFRDAGWRTALVTDFVPPAWLRSFPFRGRLRDAIEQRGRDLEGIDIVMPAPIACERVAQRVFRRSTSIWSAEELGRRAAEIAKKRGGLLLAYSTYGYTAFPNAGSNVRKILFQMHPHADACVKILEEIAGLKRRGEQRIEWEHRLSAKSFELYRQEWQAAEGVLAASTFTKRTLIDAGVAEARVRVVPYGSSDPGLTTASSRTGGPLRLLFVGSFVRRKGALDVARLAARAGRDKVEVHACGRGLAEPEVLDAFRHAQIVTHWEASEAEVKRLRGECEAFLFPSYIEGFAHVVLESLNAGLPVIASNRTCAADLVIDGEHGWVVPAGDEAALHRVVDWCVENREKLHQMRGAARARGLEFTWDRFRRKVVSETEALLSRD